jgi:hypothetical protein
VNVSDFDLAVCRSMSEAVWLQHVRMLAASLGWRTYHTRDSRGSEAGFPDLALLRVPVLWLPELKTERGRVRAEQQVWVDELELVTEVRSGIWRPSMRFEIEQVLR